MKFHPGLKVPVNISLFLRVLKSQTLVLHSRDLSSACVPSSLQPCPSKSLLCPCRHTLANVCLSRHCHPTKMSPLLYSLHGLSPGTFYLCLPVQPNTRLPASILLGLLHSSCLMPPRTRCILPHLPAVLLNLLSSFTSCSPMALWLFTTTTLIPRFRAYL